MVPGPRPSDRLDEPAGRPEGTGCPRSDAPRVAITRGARGWVVVPLPGGGLPGDHVESLVEGMTLADLVADEWGGLPEPDRSARRAARGPVGDPEETNGTDARIAGLERTVAQLEHALAARVSTERAIGVLAERHGSSPRAAFEALRREARTQGRPVVDLAREVLDGLAVDAPEPAVPVPVPAAAPAAPAPRPVRGAVVATADGRS
ncbi:ANTAR domain-containing protein [Blastococcus xanthinilyticus]|uniref:ANTAR domain-containing protein n=1 Tax=Blastococcus xanthinilyticus TaxID=1564164 RepID=A0A5S5D1P3_9ACTN|nr:ANTAR domain-containing protein [Blastococcus xanthinilyticus]